MNIKVLAALAAAAVMAASVTACGKKTDDKDTSESKAESSAAEKDTESTPEEDSAAESSEAPTESKPEEEEEKFNYIGEKDAKKADYSVKLTNGTEHEIIGFAINYGDGEYSENLIPDGEDFEIDEVRLFNWSHTVSGDVMMLGDFNVEITLDDGQRFELHGFPLTDMLSAEIRLMDEYAFLVYTNKIGDVKDTMKKEADIVEDEKEKEAAKTSTTTEAPIPEPEPETDTEPVTEPEPQPEPQTDTQAENSQAEQPQVTDQQNVDGQTW